MILATPTERSTVIEAHDELALKRAITTKDGMDTKEYIERARAAPEAD